MSFQLESNRKCLECGFPIGGGSYADRVLVPLKNGGHEERFLHGGPCAITYAKRGELPVLPHRYGP
jgi:hypothetical protein